MRARTAILISGRGSNMRSLIAAATDPAFPAEIVLVVSNVGNAEGLKHAANAGIATKVIPHKAFVSREAFDAAIDAALAEADRIVADWRSHSSNEHRCHRRDITCSGGNCYQADYCAGDNAEHTWLMI